ncbi:MAG: phage holin family protein [Actinomycetota bacterium]|nr:phage holin family protein [Actinomycetota bacterium]
MSTPTDSTTETSEQRPSVGGLLGEVSKDLSELVRQEIALAKAEATQSATRVGKGAGLLGGAGMAGHFVLLFLSIALWWGLGNSTGRAWSALIVAAIWAVICAALALTGKSQLSSVRGLDRTSETVKKIPTALKGHEEENS